MSCWNRRITALLAVLLICTLSACGQSQIPLDYGDETAFEADLNAGKNLVGKTVSFVAAELHPQSLYGYDIWAGEHLNFISSKNPDTFPISHRNRRTPITSSIFHHAPVQIVQAGRCKLRRPAVLTSLPCLC